MLKSVHRDHHVLSMWFTQHVPVSLLQGSSVPLWPQETNSSPTIAPCDWLLLTNQLVWWETNWWKLGEWNRDRIKVAGDGDEGPSVCVNDDRSCSCFPEQRLCSSATCSGECWMFAFVSFFPILSPHYISEGKYFDQIKQIRSADRGKANGWYIFKKKLVH